MLKTQRNVDLNQSKAKQKFGCRPKPLHSNPAYMNMNMIHIIIKLYSSVVMGT